MSVRDLALADWVQLTPIVRMLTILKETHGQRFCELLSIIRLAGMSLVCLPELERGMILLLRVRG